MKKIQFLIASVFLFSCSDFYRPGQLEKIDKLLFELEEIEDSCYSSDFDTIPIILTEVERMENKIKQNYVDDTLSLSFAKKLDSFQSIRKGLAPLNKIVPGIFERIDIERRAIKNLKHDINNSTGDRAMYEDNISFETENVNDLRELADQCVATKELNVEIFNNLHEDLRSYSIKLIQENKER